MPNYMLEAASEGSDLRRSWQASLADSSALEEDGFSEWALDAQEQMPDILGEIFGIYHPDDEPILFPLMIDIKIVNGMLKPGHFNLLENHFGALQKVPL